MKYCKGDHCVQKLGCLRYKSYREATELGSIDKEEIIESQYDKKSRSCDLKITKDDHSCDECVFYDSIHCRNYDNDMICSQFISSCSDI